MSQTETETELTYGNAVAHIIALGFTETDADSIAAMDIESDNDRLNHYEYILGCDADDITRWIGVRPNGGAA